MARLSSESAAQVFSRLGVKEHLGDLGLPLFSLSDSAPAGLPPGSVVEVCGCEGVGKTELLLNVAALCILPKSWKGVDMSGRSVRVVYVCTDYKFSVLRLASILETKIRSKLACSVPPTAATPLSSPAHQPTPSDSSAQRDWEEVDRLVLECLDRLHLLRCSSSSELAVALHSLRAFLSRHPDTCLLALDHVGSFYWADKVECGSRHEFERRQATWLGALSELVRDHHLVVMAARLNFKPSHIAEDLLGRQWQHAVDYRYLLQRLGPTSVAAKREHSHPMTTHPSTTTPPALFLAQQLFPPGQSWKFRINEEGLVFEER